MSYLIDETPVNDRVDWRHRLHPGRAQSRREESFPGIAERFPIKGPVMGVDLEVVGYLEGTGATGEEAIGALHTAIIAQNELKEADSGEHSVTIHGQAYEDMELVDFGTIGAVIAVAASSGSKVIQQCRWAWRQLRA